QLNSPIPNFVFIGPIPGGNEFEEFKAGNWAGWLAAEHSPGRLGGRYTPRADEALDSIPQPDRAARETLRNVLTSQVERDRQRHVAHSQNAAFERMKGMDASADLFDVNKLPAKDRERYGPGSFAQHALMARDLVEHGAPFVMVANGMNWD